MKIKKSLAYFIFLLPIFIVKRVESKAPFGACTHSIVKLQTAKKNIKKNPYALVEEPEEDDSTPEDQLVTHIKNAFITAFNMSRAYSPKAMTFQNKEIDITFYNQLINLLSCIYEWLEQSKKAPQQYKSYIVTIKSFIEYVFQYSKVLFDIEHKKLKSLTAAQLNSIKNSIEAKFKTIISINSAVVKEVDKSLDNSKEWKSSIPTKSQLKELFTLYEKDFKTYLQEKKENKTLSEKEFFKILIEKKNQYWLEDTVNDLETLIYRLKHSLELNVAHQLAFIKFCTEYLNTIITSYGNGIYFTSDSLQDKLKKDLTSEVLIKLTKYSAHALNKLLTEIEYLLDIAEGKWQIGKKPKK